nr:type II and III secretion system protein [Methylocucumis oryzae]
MQVGSQVAVITSNLSNTQSANDSGTNLLANFTYVDTGVILGFTPTILEDAKVELKISQEVSEAGTSSNNTPPIFKRKVETVLTANSGETIMIGGLITHNEDVTDTKVPWLGDIPVLGWLFSTLSRSDKSTNMVILITPHIVSNSAEAAYLTKSFQEQMNWNVKDEISKPAASGVGK